MRCNLVGNDAFAHIFFVGQAQMLFGCDVAQHGCAVPTNLCRANTAGNVVIAWRNIGN